MLEEYKKANRDLWNNLAKIHVKSKFYDVAGFVKGKSSLHPMVLNLVGPVAGL